MAIVVVMAAFVLPFTRTTLNAMSLNNDARNLTSGVSLAKMRAAAYFTQARLYVDLAGRSFHVERWQKTGVPGWVTEGPTTTLSSTASFGFAGVGAPPPNTQAAIGQAPPCLNAAGQAIAGTACEVFNSRGVPIDDTNAPFGSGAFYVSDGSVVFGVTISAGGLIRLWRANVVGGTWALY